MAKIEPSHAGMEIVSFVLGPVMTNAYLIADHATKEAAVIDPAWDREVIVEAAHQRGWDIRHIWLTHAHFDHIGGAAAVARLSNPAPQIALHPADRLLWSYQGGAPLFGMRIEQAPEPAIILEHGQCLQLGSFALEVRHTPGHTPGHVLFYCASQGVMFCGDVIFMGSIGRTDLPGGSYETLMNSIRTQVLTLPDETRLLSGHGEPTTIGQEKQWNPFLS